MYNLSNILLQLNPTTTNNSAGSTKNFTGFIENLGSFVFTGKNTEGSIPLTPFSKGELAPTNLTEFKLQNYNTHKKLETCLASRFISRGWQAWNFKPETACYKGKLTAIEPTEIIKTNDVGTAYGEPVPINPKKDNSKKITTKDNILSADRQKNRTSEQPRLASFRLETLN